MFKDVILSALWIIATILIYFLSYLFLFLTVDAPKITRVPENQSVTTGADIMFTVEATGDELHFQWQKDSQDIDSSNSRFSFNQTASTSTLKIHCVKKSDIGHYKCLVKNPVEQRGKVSSEAELRVCKFQCLQFCLVLW